MLMLTLGQFTPRARPNLSEVRTLIFSQKKLRTTLELIASIVIGALHAGRTKSFQALSKLGLIGRGSERNDAERSGSGFYLFYK
jgi:hypothetical protein